MKCDAREIACAIDRLTRPVSGVSEFDWWAQIWIPVILGLLTLTITAGVAVASVLVARRSNALARQSLALSRQAINVSRKADEAARDAAMLKARTEIGLELVEMLNTRSKEVRGGNPSPSSGAMHRTIRSKLNFLGEPNSTAVIVMAIHIFDGMTAQTKDRVDEVARLLIKAEQGIAVWVRTPSRFSDCTEEEGLSFGTPSKSPTRFGASSSGS